MLNTFSYGGVDSSQFGIFCERETHFILPEQTVRSKEVPGMDGFWDYKASNYKARPIVLSLYSDGDFENIRASKEAITAWLSNSGEPKPLFFGDDPTRVYQAKATGAINFQNDAESIGSITFTCNPPWPYLNGVPQTPDEITWQTAQKDGNQFLQSFSAPGHMRFSNIGTLSVKPKIKILGNIRAGLNLAYNGAEWQYNADLINDGIIVDCAAGTVLRGSDGANLLMNVDPIKNAYFQFAPGQINIDVTANGLGAWPQSIVVIVEFNPLGV